MANLDFAGGFEPIRKRDGSALVCEYLTLASNNAEIFKFDPVERSSDGVVIPCVAASVACIGVAAEYKAASSGGELAYFPIENTIFLAQADDTVDAQTDFDLTYNFVVGAGDALTKRSTFEIDGSSQAASAVQPVKILKVHYEKTQDGNALGNNVKVECIIHEGAFNGAGLIG